jgi:hypothetical protein
MSGSHPSSSIEMPFSSSTTSRMQQPIRASGYAMLLMLPLPSPQSGSIMHGGMLPLCAS